MKKYIFELVIFEGNDEFWEGYNPVYEGKRKTPRGYATDKEVDELVQYTFEQQGWAMRNDNYTLKLKKVIANAKESQ
jgi:hypothetical protein